jgi:acetyl-CoA acyltransferase
VKRAVVVEAIRTPVGNAKPDTGIFRDVRADELSAFLMQKLVERTGIDPNLIEDVRWGCVQQFREQGVCVARIAALTAGLPITIPGVTINRNCGSSLSAINECAKAIAAGCEDVQIAGGVEHMHHVPMTAEYDPGPALFKRHGEGIMYMGLTAEYLATKYRISREQQDEFALASHVNAARATNEGLFKDEIVPTWGRDEQGVKQEVTVDQCIRFDTTAEGLAKLPPVFNPRGGSVTAGNSSPLNVGAAATLIMSEEKAAELGLTPIAEVRASAVAGVAPEEMGIGPVPAVHKALDRAGLKLADIGAIELNEAFAVQCLSVLKLLGHNGKNVNTRGGAIAIGHPLGGSGARIATTLLHRMRDDGIKYGLATMCVGQGQGVATVFELCE